MVCLYCGYGEEAIVLGSTILKWIRKIKCVCRVRRAVVAKWIQVPGMWVLLKLFQKLGEAEFSVILFLRQGLEVSALGYSEGKVISHTFFYI